MTLLLNMSHIITSEKANSNTWQLRKGLFQTLVAGKNNFSPPHVWRTETRTWQLQPNPKPWSIQRIKTMACWRLKSIASTSESGHWLCVWGAAYGNICFYTYHAVLMKQSKRERTTTNPLKLCLYLTTCSFWLYMHEEKKLKSFHGTWTANKICFHESLGPHLLFPHKVVSDPVASTQKARQHENPQLPFIYRWQWI